MLGSYAWTYCDGICRKAYAMRLRGQIYWYIGSGKLTEELTGNRKKIITKLKKMLILSSFSKILIHLNDHLD